MGAHPLSPSVGQLTNTFTRLSDLGQRDGRLHEEVSFSGCLKFGLDDFFAGNQYRPAVMDPLCDPCVQINDEGLVESGGQPKDAVVESMFGAQIGGCVEGCDPNGFLPAGPPDPQIVGCRIGIGVPRGNICQDSEVAVDCQLAGGCPQV